MSLTKTWSPYFQSRIRMRGRAYFLASRVHQQPPEPGEIVRAKVRGRQMYTVVLEQSDDDQIRPRCTCPSFASGQYCKHIWATLLDVQHNGALDDREPADQPADQTHDATAQPVPSPEPAQPLNMAPRLPKARKRTGDAAPATRGQPDWIRQLALLRPTAFGMEPAAPTVLPQDRQVCYQVEPELSARHNGLIIRLMQRIPRRRGWSRSRSLRVNTSAIRQLADPLDRELCSLLLGSDKVYEEDADSRWSDERAHDLFRVPANAQRLLLDMLIRTHRCFVGEREDAPPLQWDPASREQPWVLWLRGELTDDNALRAQVELRRDDDRLPIEKPALVLGGPSGIIIHRNRAAWFDDREAFRWVQQFRDDLRRSGEASPIIVPKADVEGFLDRLYMLPQLPEIDFPQSIQRTEQHLDPVPHLELFSPSPGNGGPGGRDQLLARAWFTYGTLRVRPDQQGRFVSAAVTDDPEAAEPEAESEHTGGNGDQHDEKPPDKPEPGTLIRRDLGTERQLLRQLSQLGFRTNTSDADGTLLIASSRVPGAVSRLIHAGWRVQADKRVIRSPGTVNLSVSSGIDWFELRGGVRFQTQDGEQTVDLPTILAAARAGRNMITLDDGSQGLLPEQWLREHGLLAALGKLEGDHLRFRSSQAALLDALLAEQELIEVDDRFEQARQRVRQFQQVQRVTSGDNFQGTLRHYQQDGLGWLYFLRWFGMGGILADDMGLGKTIQVLAMLDRHYVSGHDEGHDEPANQNDKTHRPSLVVAPRSVLFNWADEAQRFTPRLRVQIYAGADRIGLRQAFSEHDVIVTSYGLLRRDATELAENHFHYVVLDEAQAIKNPVSQGAKAARLLKAEHRLALTGTPVENHLGDLWSIFEFLNPGMLGSNSGFADVIKGGVSDPQSVEAAKQAGKALRPFILRRTKKQVLAELPEKTEQTILCEMPDHQRRMYDNLKQHYRGTLLKQIDAKSGNGFGRNTVLVLEALLRLRQAACHPGLIDNARSGEPSAKLDALLAQLEEIIDEGSKALVFSQFTSFLALAKKQLDERKITYEYLDGQTRDRRKPVERFQNDPKCPVFLISLKAGGLGLNLTAAEYVFILDPWWNPAVEQQAIDRAHRIGQTRRVFAYRLICENTVEQRIAELQARKRELADAIVGGEQSIIRQLTREDLEQLLS